MSDKLVKPTDPRRGLPSASAMERYFACPGSYLLSKNVEPGEIPETEYAQAGQRIHSAREAGDVSELDLSEADVVEQMAKDEEAIYHRWCDDYQITDAEIVQERRVWLTSGHRKLCSAQIDFYALSRLKQMALVLDRKSGRKGVQPPTRNWQLKTALVILASNYSLIGGRVAIVQPFARRQNPCDYSPDDIYALGGAWDQLSQLLVQVENPAAPRITGPHCDFCPAKGICPEANALVSSVAALKGLSWSAYTAGVKFDLWERCRIAQDIIDQINFLIKRDVEFGLIPGLTMTKETHPRKILSATKLYDELAIRMSDPAFDAHYDQLATVSVGALEEYIREQRGGSKAAAKEWVDQNLAELITTTTHKGHVAKEKT